MSPCFPATISLILLVDTQQILWNIANIWTLQGQVPNLWQMTELPDFCSVLDFPDFDWLDCEVDVLFASLFPLPPSWVSSSNERSVRDGDATDPDRTMDRFRLHEPTTNTLQPVTFLSARLHLGAAGRIAVRGGDRSSLIAHRRA